MTEVEYLKDLIGKLSPKLLEHAENDMYGQEAAHGRIYQVFDQYGEIDFEEEYGIRRNHMSGVYTYKDLTENDKSYVDGFDAAIEEISEGCDEYIIDQVCADHEDMDSIAGQMKRELIDAVFSHLLTILEGRRQNIIVSMIDGYDDE